ncbi:hypothetical protein BD324DRAFT_624273 [Kockovaella imperatae]|uniref:Uncharacterized protein n=1 Tax=Kockovaella imperatae TaxID=4999 RepID=A0A1Y1UJ66_9TREE|nr:hypothetical protein BD324DRAFT_624273 [Kockovaella imperatae]ORX38032.1 hypothetical protein BD324DRAFT_624273 [Kockovaella imperatae]
MDSALSLSAQNVRPSSHDISTVSSLDLPKPVLVKGATRGVPDTYQRRITHTITSLSETLAEHRVLHSIDQHPSSMGGKPIRAVPLMGHQGSQVDDHGDRAIDPIVASLPRSISKIPSISLNHAPDLRSKLTPLTPIRIAPVATDHPARLVLDNEDDSGLLEGDQTLTARPRSVLPDPSQTALRSYSPSGSHSLTTIKPDTLGHHRQLYEYNLVLSALGHRQSLSMETVVPPPVKVDELVVEWCYFCGKEKDRAELQLVDVSASASSTGRGGNHTESNAGNQWICRDGCDPEQEIVGERDLSWADQMSVGSGREARRLSRESRDTMA